MLFWVPILASACQSAAQPRQPDAASREPSECSIRGVTRPDLIEAYHRLNREIPLATKESFPAVFERLQLLAFDKCVGKTGLTSDEYLATQTTLEDMQQWWVQSGSRWLASHMNIEGGPPMRAFPSDMRPILQGELLCYHGEISDVMPLAEKTGKVESENLAWEQAVIAALGPEVPKGGAKGRDCAAAQSTSYLDWQRCEQEKADFELMVPRYLGSVPHAGVVQVWMDVAGEPCRNYLAIGHAIGDLVWTQCDGQEPEIWLLPRAASSASRRLNDATREFLWAGMMKTEISIRYLEQASVAVPQRFWSEELSGIYGIPNGAFGDMHGPHVEWKWSDGMRWLRRSNQSARVSRANGYVFKLATELRDKIVSDVATIRMDPWPDDLQRPEAFHAERMRDCEELGGEYR